MRLQNNKKLKEIRKRLEKAEPSRTLPKNASKVEEEKIESNFLP